MANEKKVKVVLISTYSDGKQNPGPGTVLEVDASEAEHLIAAGGAKPYEPEAAAAE
jgi:methylmalonyl-CoA mutase cobalamin-binding subunit